MARDDRAPVVLLDLDYHNGAFELVLVNIGNEPTFDIGVSFSPELIGLGGAKVISSLPLWKHLHMLRPGREIRVFVDSAPNVFRRKGSHKFTATVAWRSFDGGKHSATYRHDFGAYRELPQIVPDRD